MFTWVFDVTVRHRRTVLLIGIALGVVQAALTALTPTTVASLAVIILSIVLVGMAGVRQARPAAFDVRDDAAAFTAPAAAWLIFFSLCLLAFAGDRVGSVARSVRADAWLWTDVGVAGLQILAVTLFVTHVWKGYDISLRPDGLYDRRGLGTVIVPWEAVPTPRAGRNPGRPAAAQATDPADDLMAKVRLDYVRPDLVRRQGLVWNTKRIHTVHLDAGFLAGAIDFYAQHPEHRAGIGTDSGYQLLQQALAAR